MNTLLTITAAAPRPGPVLRLLVAPSLMVQGLLGGFRSVRLAARSSPAASSGGGPLARCGLLAGYAVTSLRRRAAASLIPAMLVYNVAAVLVLGHARFGLGIAEAPAGLLPGVILPLGRWRSACVACLLNRWRQNVRLTEAETWIGAATIQDVIEELGRLQESTRLLQATPTRRASFAALPFDASAMP